MKRTIGERILAQMKYCVENRGRAKFAAILLEELASELWDDGHITDEEHAAIVNASTPLTGFTSNDYHYPTRTHA